MPHLPAAKLKINKNSINIIIYAQLDTGSYVHSIQAAWHELKRVTDAHTWSALQCKGKATFISLDGKEHSTQDERKMAPKNGDAFVERVGNDPCPWHVSLASYSVSAGQR